MFCSVRSANKIESLQKRAPWFLLDNNTLCSKKLLGKADKVKRRVSMLRTLSIDFYKTINSLYPSFMNDIFKVKMF